MPEATIQTQVLCVDDEPQVLEGLARHLRRRYQVFTATTGAAGLQVLAAERAIAVVVSDMRMPGMDGAAFLSKARQVAPDAVRILLTGDDDLTSAAAAVDDGEIFRCLSKPCPAPTLAIAIEAAAVQHRLVTAERGLLEETVHGSIERTTSATASPARRSGS